jgi:hypothetical protein
VWPDALMPRRSALGGVKYYPDGIYRLRDMWISK